MNRTRALLCLPICSCVIEREEIVRASFIQSDNAFVLSVRMH